MDKKAELLRVDWGRHEEQIRRIASVFGLTSDQADELVFSGELDQVYGKVYSSVENWMRLPLSRFFIGVAAHGLLFVNKAIYGDLVQDGFYNLQVGFPGRMTIIRKIPTMRKDAHEEDVPADQLSAFAGAAGKNRKDDRILGKWAEFLRRWGIDEFPQLLDIAEGRISLFGLRGLTDKELKDLQNLQDYRDDTDIDNRASAIWPLLDKYLKVVKRAEPDEALVSPLSSAGSKDLNFYSRLYGDALLMSVLAEDGSITKKLLWNTFWTRLFGKGVR